MFLSLPFPSLPFPSLPFPSLPFPSLPFPFLFPFLFFPFLFPFLSFPFLSFPFLSCPFSLFPFLNFLVLVFSPRFFPFRIFHFFPLLSFPFFPHLVYSSSLPSLLFNYVLSLLSLSSFLFFLPLISLAHNNNPKDHFQVTLTTTKTYRINKLCQFRPVLFPYHGQVCHTMTTPHLHTTASKI